MENVFSRNETTKEEFNTQEKRVLQHMVKAYFDIRNSTTILEKENPVVFMKSVLALIFVLADTMSRFYDLMENRERIPKPSLFCWTSKKSRSNQKRFRKWIDKFVLTDKNHVYRDRKKDINCDSKLIWKLRNSIVHFYGLPNPGVNKEQLMLVNGPWQNVEKLKKLPQSFRKKGRKIRIIDFDSLGNAILDSHEPWTKYLLKTLKENPDGYIQGIRRILSITEKEGTVEIDLRTNKRIR